MELETSAECSVCRSTFDYEGEGGIQGDFGILPVAFCPTCLSSMFNLVEQHCEQCIDTNNEDEDEPTVGTLTWEEWRVVFLGVHNFDFMSLSMTDDLKKRVDSVTEKIQAIGKNLNRKRDATRLRRLGAVNKNKK